jgi:hypothetical protein
MIRIERGTATPEEIAALVGALLGRRRPASRTRIASRWAASARPAGRGLVPGPGAWRASALPR